MLQTFAILFAVFITCVASTSAGAITPEKSAENYQRCTTLSASSPTKALAMAEKWIQTDNTPSAYHCRAISLFALKRYSLAAAALEDLGTKLTDNNLTLLSNVLRQAAKSWELAGEASKAITVLTQAIRATSDVALDQPPMARVCAELLMDRGVLYLAGGRDLYAVQDFDQGLSLMPDHPALLLARAKLFIKLQENILARKDLNTLLKAQPGHATAGALLNQLPSN